MIPKMPLVAILGAILSVAPHAAHAAAAVCGEGSWRLDGASARPAPDGKAVFAPEWLPSLEEAAACLSERPYACVEAQGAFDERNFSHEVIAAFGSEQAAQQARARGRASVVLSRLIELGVRQEQLRQRAPGSEPSYRGVELRLVEECLPRPQGLSEEERETLRKARELLEAPPPPAPPANSRNDEGPRLPTFFVEAGARSSLAVVDPASVFSPALRLGLGGVLDRFYGRAGLAVARSSREEQQSSIEFDLGAGYGLLPWLELGATGGMRFGSAELGAAWLERSWYLGAEGVECFLPLGGGSLCLHQAIHPFGSQTRRARIEQRLERIEPVDDWLVRFELGVFFRQHL